MILDIQWKDDARKDLILNIGDELLTSGSMLLDYEGSLFKFIMEDDGERTVEERKIWDSWSTIKTVTKSLDAVNIVHYDEENADLKFSQSVDDMFLFEITSDEGERYNLLDPMLPYFDLSLNEQLLENADYLLQEFFEDDELFSPVLEGLFEQLPEGDPTLVADGSFMRPFLNNAEYKDAISAMFAEDPNGHSRAFHALYEEPWISPNAPGE